MPHIHTEPNQHDMTVSAYVLRKDGGEWKCLVHMHRKIDMLMQIGGHIELNQTPWQAIAEELLDEAGYDLSELKILQPDWRMRNMTETVLHPVPFCMNTHSVGNDHYHSDCIYAFTAEHLPDNLPKHTESHDLRWYSLEQLQLQADAGVALQDCTDVYKSLIGALPSLHPENTNVFSLNKPEKGITYKRNEV